MNKLDDLFRNGSPVLSVYFTAGFPALNDTTSIIRALECNGVDLVEIGIPFSDPLADGPVIQRSSELALKNGMNIQLLFEQLRGLTECKIPLVLMGYLNPILQFGFEKFCAEASAIGISALIIPDLPINEYLEQYRSIFEKYDLRAIFLITPQTSDDRIRLIDDVSSSFIYMVASSSTTGVKSGISDEQIRYFERVRSLNLKNPLITGFGISDAESFEKVCRYSSGAIIGSAFIQAIQGEGELDQKIRDFIGNIKIKELQS